MTTRSHRASVVVTSYNHLWDNIKGVCMRCGVRSCESPGPCETASYAAVTLAELAEAKREIAMLRDIVVIYGDRLRMATVHHMDWQQAIDRAFDREE